VLAAVAVVLGLVGAGCYAQDMANQDRYQPLQSSELFENGMASRLPIEGTVARGQLFADDHLYRGLVDGAPAATFPFEVTADVLARGQERYQIFCTPCHDQLGTGNGIVVQRGFRRPSSFHVDRLRDAPPGYLYDVMTTGFGAMSSYASQVPVEDRWAIVAYIRALQLSQNASETELEAQDFERLGGQR
jgi:hypothetical protein